uniref:eEF1A lysine and N-terminal methyltransferase n=1 Tax=Gorilla gorilla gorilla TaxID=9595 RepID=A0A2I2Z2N9_GORGO
MNLLPKSSKEFGSVDYWEKFFQQRGKKAFEWYGTYLELCGVLHKYIKPREKVLVIGCGNSELSEQLYDVGYRDIVNIDISEVVIKQMKECNATRRPQMSFLKMDMTQMEFPDASFQVVLDKGTLDAVLTDEEEKTLQQVDRMLAESLRAGRPSGSLAWMRAGNSWRPVLWPFTEVSSMKAWTTSKLSCRLESWSWPQLGCPASSRSPFCLWVGTLGSGPFSTKTAAP